MPEMAARLHCVPVKHASPKPRSAMPPCENSRSRRTHSTPPGSRLSKTPAGATGMNLCAASRTPISSYFPTRTQRAAYRDSGLVQHPFRDLSAGCRGGEPLPAVNRSPVKIARPAVQPTGVFHDRENDTTSPRMNYLPTLCRRDSEMFTKRTPLSADLRDLTLRIFVTSH